MSIYKFCPVCGCEFFHDIQVRCIDCGYSEKASKQTTNEYKTKYNRAYKIHLPPYIPKHSQEYYEQMSTSETGTSENWYKAMIENELSKNPLFDMNKHLLSCERQEERNKRVAYRETHPEEFIPYKPNTEQTDLKPKCPTCGSVNICKISDVRRGVHWVMWGLLSNTARSQFECKNCGYKW